MFSDNIIFAVRVVQAKAINDLNVKRLCSIASRMQELFLRERNILFRGCITKGSLYIDEKFVFGQGLIKAYHLENNCGFYPRIIIDHAIQEEPYILQSEHRIDSELLYDNYKFINFLCYYIPTDNYLSNRKISKIIHAVNALISSTTDVKALQKIKWTKKYRCLYNKT